MSDDVHRDHCPPRSTRRAGIGPPRRSWTVWPGRSRPRRCRDPRISESCSRSETAEPSLSSARISWVVYLVQDWRNVVIELALTVEFVLKGLRGATLLKRETVLRGKIALQRFRLRRSHPAQLEFQQLRPH